MTRRRNKRQTVAVLINTKAHLFLKMKNSNLVMFTVVGPFEVPLRHGSRCGYIETRCPDFWEKHPEYRAKRGCYVFAMRAAKGYRPVYVGKTKKTFEKEIFESHKVADHYTPALAKTGRGTPVMFFVIAPPKTGKTTITNLEKFLIKIGVAKNPELSNIQNRQEAEWGIKGILLGGKGKKSKTAIQFSIMMGLG